MKYRHYRPSDPSDPKPEDAASFAPLPEQAELLRRCLLYQKLWQAHIGAQGWAVTSGAKEGQ